MNYTTEQQVILYYLDNLVRRPLFGDTEDNVCCWFEDNSLMLIGQDVTDIWENRRQRWGAASAEPQPLPRNVRTLRQFIEKKKNRLVFTPEINAVIDAFRLSPDSQKIIALTMHIADSPTLQGLAEIRRGHAAEELMPRMLGMSSNRFELLARSLQGELVQKGLICGEKRFNKSQADFYPSPMLQEIIRSHCRTVKAVQQAALGKPLKATLKPEMFEHLTEEYDWVKNILQSALKKKQRGINVLFYGKSGTGKTELAKTLCQEIGVPLYAVSENRHEERTGSQRRYDLAAADTLLQNENYAVLMMDESEDVFGASPCSGLFGISIADSDGRATKSKLFFNRLLENNCVPVIWICNSIRGVDKAHLRRFSYCLQVEEVNAEVRNKIWTHSARKYRVRIPADTINRLAKEYETAPAIIDTALRTAALTSDTAAIEKTIESLQTAMNGKRIPKKIVDENVFSVELLNTDTDLNVLAQRIAGLKQRRFSLCLNGVPGSGKSAYARYLADKLKMKILYKRASDLLSMWVGGNEQNIAAMFAEAQQKKMFLVLDEADGFLRDRRLANHSWETTLVNEMLTQMETHTLPFVCTTNLMDELDQASLRRFTFKVKYDYLKKEQVAKAFQHFFAAESTVSLTDLTSLSPGDFAVVKKEADIFGIDDHCELVKMLRKEQDVKENEKPPIGFSM